MMDGLTDKLSYLYPKESGLKGKYNRKTPARGGRVCTRATSTEYAGALHLPVAGVVNSTSVYHLCKFSNQLVALDVCLATWTLAAYPLDSTCSPIAAPLGPGHVQASGATLLSTDDVAMPWLSSVTVALVFISPPPTRHALSFVTPPNDQAHSFC